MLLIKNNKSTNKMIMIYKKLSNKAFNLKTRFNNLKKIWKK